MLAQVLEGLGTPDMGKVAAAARAPREAGALFEAGYVLIEQSYPGFAATVLSHAVALAPEDERTLAELATAFEMFGDYTAAALALGSRPAALADSFLLSYLEAFLSALAGDLELLERSAEGLLARAADDTQRFMAERLVGIARRAARAKGVVPLDLEDARGWHAVLFGGLQLNRVPGGSKGRGAMMVDDHATCRAAIERLAVTLKALGIEPARVFVLRDEPSAAALALAVSRVLGIKAENWPEGGSDEPGLIPIYDLKMVSTAIENTLRQHRPGQILWERFAAWTTEARFVADLTDTFAQAMTPPWGRVHAGSDGLMPDVWADAIADAERGDGAIDPTVARLGGALDRALGAAAAGVWRDSGLRLKRWPWGVR